MASGLGFGGDPELLGERLAASDNALTCFLESVAGGFDDANTGRDSFDYRLQTTMAVRELAVANDGVKSLLSHEAGTHLP